MATKNKACLSHTKLAELSIANDERSKSAETLKSFIAVLLGSLLVNWCAGSGCIATRDLLCLPDKVLKKVTLVLGEKKDLCLLNHITKVSNEVLSFC